jgi:quinol monooxygenase YgiN
MRNILTTLIVLFLAAASEGFSQDTRLYVVTHVDLTPNYTADGTKLLEMFATDSRKDPGIVRFELLQQLGRANHLAIVEVWANQKAFDAHLEANHTKQFREKLQPMLGSPFDERLHNLLK